HHRCVEDLRLWDVAPRRAGAYTERAAARIRPGAELVIGRRCAADPIDDRWDHRVTEAKGFDRRALRPILTTPSSSARVTTVWLRASRSRARAWTLILERRPFVGG